MHRIKEILMIQRKVSSSSLINPLTPSQILKWPLFSVYIFTIKTLIIGFFFEWWKGGEFWVVYILFVFLYFLISVSTLFFKFYIRICISGYIYLSGEIMPNYTKDLTFGVVLCSLNMQLHIVISISKCGNNYFK